MRRKMFVVILSFVTLFSGNIFAQKEKEEIIIRIGDENITKSEFLTSFQKNNQLSATSPEELREYLDLYIDFRLKVIEGKTMFIDTAIAFQKELESYRNQSAKNYLVDKDVSDQLIDEGVYRLMHYIRASHILVDCPPNASPQDTLIAYNKTMSIREEILNGMAFAEAAVKYSDDISARDTVHPSTKQKRYGNKGDLGYFTAFQLIYPFETGAYNTPVGSISMPVRTAFGYHIIYVEDKIPAYSKIEAAQIFISDSLAAEGKMTEETARKLANIQEGLEEGTSFEELVREFSEDMASKEKNGVLTPFVPNRRAGDFVKQAISLNPGEISEPFPTPMGWHILKLISAPIAEESEEIRYFVKNKISNDSRSHKSKISLAEKLKTEYHYNESGKEKAIRFFVKNLPATYLQSTVNILDLKGLAKLKPMTTFADQKIEASDFAKYLSRFQGVNTDKSLEEFIREKFAIYANERILKYENDNLENKYPEFNALVQEYQDGMILFEVMSTNVWGKAIQDSTGLEQYYEQIKYKYPDEENAGEYKPLNEIRALVITEYQDYLNEQWISELKRKYPVVIYENVYNTILKK